MLGSGSPAAVVNTMNMLCQPDLTLLTRASTIWLTQRMMSSRISTACSRAPQQVEGMTKVQ